MPEADRCSLNIPFPSWARDDSNRPESDFENWKELSRWADHLLRECLPTGGGKLPFYVAASDASDESKSLSNYLCTGTDDHLTVQRAVDDIRALYTGSGSEGPGAAVWLSEGTFNFGDVVSLYGTSDNGHISVRGMGPSSTFLKDSTASGGFHGTSDAAFTINASTQASGDALVIEGIRFEDFRWGVQLWEGALTEPDHCRFRNCYFLDCFGGLYLEGRAGSTTTDCVFERGTYGVYNYRGDHHVIGCDFLGNDTDIYIEEICRRISILNNISSSPNDYFVYAQGAVDHLIISDNSIVSTGTASIMLNGNSTNEFKGATITNNNISSAFTTPDISVANFVTPFGGDWTYLLNLHNNHTDGSIFVDVGCYATGNFAADGMIVGANCDKGLVANNWLGDSGVWNGVPDQTLTNTGGVSTGAGNMLDGVWTP